MGIFTRRSDSISPEKAKAAALALGVELEGITEDAVRKAYRAIARAAHPDVGGDHATAAAQLSAAASARNTLIAWIEDLPTDDCATCKGAGFVRAGAFGASKPCPTCTR